MLLALTCSSTVGSVSVFNGSQPLKTLRWESERSHAEYVSQKISEITKDYPLNTLTTLAVDVGPGSFTGIRIAVNTIKTMGYALDIPIVRATSLETLAQQAHDRDVPIVCLIDAFSDSVYASTFFQKKQSGPHVVKSSEIKNLFKSKSICIGDGLKKYSTFLKDVEPLLLVDNHFSDTPTSESLALIASEKLKEGSTLSWQQLEPMYVRRSSAEEKLLV